LHKLAHSKQDVCLDLIAMALKSRKVSFDRTVKTIDDMVLLLGKGQAADYEKKAKCGAELDKAEC